MLYNIFMTVYLKNIKLVTEILEKFISRNTYIQREAQGTRKSIAERLAEDDIKDKNGVMSGPPGLLKLVEEAEKVLSY